MRIRSQLAHFRYIVDYWSTFSFWHGVLCLTTCLNKILIINVAVDNKPMDTVSSDIETFGQQMAEAWSVQHRARREDSMFRQTTELPRDPGHDVTRVSDDDNDSVWTVLDQFRDDAFEDSDVLLHKVKTRLSFPLTSSSRDDDDARILYTVIIPTKFSINKLLS